MEFDLDREGSLVEVDILYAGRLVDRSNLAVAGFTPVSMTRSPES